MVFYEVVVYADKTKYALDEEGNVEGNGENWTFLLEFCETSHGCHLPEILKAFKVYRKCSGGHFSLAVSLSSAWAFEFSSSVYISSYRSLFKQ